MEVEGIFEKVHETLYNLLYQEATHDSIVDENGRQCIFLQIRRLWSRTHAGPVIPSINKRPSGKYRHFTTWPRDYTVMFVFFLYLNLPRLFYSSIFINLQHFSRLNNNKL